MTSSKTKQKASTPTTKTRSSSKQVEIVTIKANSTPDLNKNEIISADIDLDKLAEKTGFSKAEIVQKYGLFKAYAPTGQLEKKNFINLYMSFRYEPVKRLKSISEIVFKCFDRENRGHITFEQFITTYEKISKGDIKKRVEMAYLLYETDNEGNLKLTDKNIQNVLQAMITLFDGDQEILEDLAEECVEKLDRFKTGKITKDDFVYALLKHYNLRVLMSPFN